MAADLADEIGRTLFRLFQEFDLEITREIERGKFGMKVSSDSGVSFAWTKDFAMQYSISCAFREVSILDLNESLPARPKFVELEFWGYLWRDLQNERKLCYPCRSPFRTPFYQCKSIQDLYKGLEEETQKWDVLSFFPSVVINQDGY